MSHLHALITDRFSSWKSHQLNVKPEEVEDLYFTGALTSSAKTDFALEYKDSDGKWRSYTPDFILRRKDGRCLIIEIKNEQHEA